jgi:hypothetical protein
MKNFIVSLATVLATGLTPVFATGTNDDPRAAKIFAKEFAGAQNIKWTRLDDGYLRVTFLLNGVAAETYFDADAEMLGTIRNLFYNQLPLSVMQTVNNRFRDAVVIDVKEITNAEGTIYKVIFEQKGRKYIVKLDSLGQVTEVQKQKLKK